MGQATSETERLRALVVDDDAAIRTMYMDALSTRFEVEGAENGAEALEKLRAASFDVIVSDQMMPGMTGTEMLQASLQIVPDAVRVLITASREIDNAIAAVNVAKVDRFFNKPVRLGELRAAAVELAERRRAEKALRARLEKLQAVESRAEGRRGRVLVVDGDESAVLTAQALLEDAGFEIEVAETGRAALDRLGTTGFDVMVLEVDLPDVSGLEVLRVARRLHPELECVVHSASPAAEAAIHALDAGAYDVLRKPLPDIDMLRRVVVRAMERQELARDRQRLLVDLLETNEALMQRNEALQRAKERIQHKMRELELLQDATVMGLTMLAEYRDMETGEHLERMRNYSRIIAEKLKGHPEFPEIDDDFIEAIYKAAPLHDIGKVGIPDRILLKPGKLTPEEWAVMRTHPTIGGRTLEEAERRARQEAPKSLLSMGKHIAYYHHERWDGTGYPYRKRGKEIPAEARIVTVADSYDAITSKRVYKPAIPHATAARILREKAGTHFDPWAVEAFLASEAEVLEVQRRFRGDDEVLAS
ncbi:MAG: response regulator [Deltaproteobacteria bacterium]|nr:MAG: response regulator [Deltaproteobacteria bacterium]